MSETKGTKITEQPMKDQSLIPLSSWVSVPKEAIEWSEARLAERKEKLRIWSKWLLKKFTALFKKDN